MNQGVACPICNSTATVERNGDRSNWHCSRCGKFGLVGSAEAVLLATPLETPAAVSGWIRQKNSQQIVPFIGSDDVDQMRMLTTPNFRERMERYLLTIVSNSPRLDSTFNPQSEDLIGASYSHDGGEAGLIHKYLLENKLVFLDGGLRSRVSAEGHMAADELKSRRSASTQGFVAMWFATAMEKIRDKGFVVGIEQAGYSAMVINKKEHVNKIDDEIIAEIRQSAFLVADFTGHRGGVYFEAGFATGLKLPVIWTCKNDDLADLHFDIRQYNCIVWNDENDLASQLKNRIIAILGVGPKLSS